MHVPSLPMLKPTSRHARLFASLIRHRLRGSPVPPKHPVKLYWIARFGHANDIEVLVETGTYLGATVAAMLDQFEQIYTIELDHELWARACDRFSQYPHVHVAQGDSGKDLPVILSRISDRCLFWLDGHFSGDITARAECDTPIVEELAAIRSHRRKDHVSLIDDAHLFNGKNDYPTLDELFSMLREVNPAYTIRVVDDIIQAFIPKSERDLSQSWSMRG